ncbi:MAG: hypothetical protein HKN10_03055 [Myxococcales bacterium]|nr:hypothetical protein [Myxococcales bacterium]
MFLLLVSFGFLTQRYPTEEQATDEPTESMSPSELLSERIALFSFEVTYSLQDNGTSNSYSHQRLLRAKKQLGEPLVQLEASDTEAAFVSTDCSGWLSFVLNTVSPLHEAVLQSQRYLPEHNQAYSKDFVLRERRRPWARAFVVAHFLRAGHVETAGFEPVEDFATLQPGDIVAYAMGRYTQPTDETRPKPKDTGHVFLVVESPTVIDKETEDYAGQGTLSEKVAKVIAVPSVDSSATVHFAHDSRVNAEGRYALPEIVPHPRAKAGGVGTGTIWLALSEQGRVLQRRLGPHQKYRPVLARAARLRGRVSLDEAIVDEQGDLVVHVFDSSPAEYGGVSYGGTPVDLTGDGGIRLASGRLVMSGDNDFAGGVTVDAGALNVESATGLGAGDVTVLGGTMTLKEPAIANDATLTLSEDLQDGALRLDFEGRDVAYSLLIGETEHRCGTWGAPGSEAQFVDPVFSGPGIIELSAEAPEPCAPSGQQSARARRHTQ